MPRLAHNTALFVTVTLTACSPGPESNSAWQAEWPHSGPAAPEGMDLRWLWPTADDSGNGVATSAHMLFDFEDSVWVPQRPGSMHYDYAGDYPFDSINHFHVLAVTSPETDSLAFEAGPKMAPFLVQSSVDRAFFGHHGNAPEGACLAVIAGVEDADCENATTREGDGQSFEIDVATGHGAPSNLDCTTAQGIWNSL